MQITTTVEIAPQQIADLVTTACECNHMTTAWCSKFWLVTPTEVPADKRAEGDEKLVWYAHPWLYTQPDLKIEVEELESESTGSTKKHYIGLPEFERAFKLMQEYGTPKGWHWRNFIEGDGDAETADVFLQLATFGEVIYG